MMMLLSIFNFAKFSAFIAQAGFLLPAAFISLRLRVLKICSCSSNHDKEFSRENHLVTLRTGQRDLVAQTTSLTLQAVVISLILSSNSFNRGDWVKASAITKQGIWQMHARNRIPESSGSRFFRKDLGLQ
jgi:hypothetical protein